MSVVSVSYRKLAAPYTLTHNVKYAQAVAKEPHDSREMEGAVPRLPRVSIHT